MTEPTTPDPAELRLWALEAVKRNDRTYAALDQLLKNLPEQDPEGALAKAWAEAEEHQQATRKALVRLRKLAGA